MKRIFPILTELTQNIYFCFYHTIQAIAFLAHLKELHPGQLEEGAGHLGPWPQAGHLLGRPGREETPQAAAGHG